MTSHRTSLSFLGFLFASVTSASAYAADVTLAPSNDVQFQAALQALSVGDRLLLRPGTYSFANPVALRSGVTIAGAGSASDAVISCASDCFVVPATTNVVSSVTIDNVTINATGRGVVLTPNLVNAATCSLTSGNVSGFSLTRSKVTAGAEAIYGRGDLRQIKLSSNTLSGAAYDAIGGVAVSILSGTSSCHQGTPYQLTFSDNSVTNGAVVNLEGVVMSVTGNNVDGIVNVGPPAMNEYASTRSVVRITSNTARLITALPPVEIAANFVGGIIAANASIHDNTLDGPFGYWRGIWAQRRSFYGPETLADTQIKNNHFKDGEGINGSDVSVLDNDFVTTLPIIAINTSSLYYDEAIAISGNSIKGSFAIGIFGGGYSAFDYHTAKMVPITNNRLEGPFQYGMLHFDALISGNTLIATSNSSPTAFLSLDSDGPPSVFVNNRLLGNLRNDNDKTRAHDAVNAQHAAMKALPANSNAPVFARLAQDMSAAADRAAPASF